MVVGVATSRTVTNDDEQGKKVEQLSDKTERRNNLISDYRTSYEIPKFKYCK